MSPLRDYREHCRRKGRPTSEQLSLTARATKSGGSRDGQAGAARTPSEGEVSAHAVMVRRLGDLVRHHLRWAACLGSVSLAAGLALTACAPAAPLPHGPVLPAHW